MGKLVEQEIKKFDGGMQTDTRRVSPTGGRLVKNFDILSFPSKLKPYNSSESGNSDPTREIVTFLATGSTLWGLGVNSGTAIPQIFNKTDFTDGSWGTTINNAGNAARATNFFTYYKGAIYGAQGGVSFYKYLTTGAGFTNQDLAATYTTVSNGIVHSKDDILYVGYDNKIALNNAGSWTLTALTLPSDCYVSSICEYGNYLAIAVAPLGSAGRQTSRVYLWDRDSSLTTLSESIDWGAGTLQVLEEYEGGLLGISQVGSRLVIKYYNGSFQKIGERKHLEFLADSAVSISQYKQKTNDRIYFLATITIDSTVQYGVWSIGRNAGDTVVKNGVSTSSSAFALSLERTPNNDTDPNSITGFYLTNQVGVDYMFIAYVDGSSNKQVSKTNDSATAYAHTSTFKTQIFDEGDSRLLKKLIRVILNLEPLPSGASYTVAYRKDAATSYTTIGTYSTANGMSHTSVNIESTGAIFPEFQEIQFLITSTGGAVITGFKYEAEILDKSI